jgi:glucose-6-phosphate dehydrogenase assembly protein OpcA
VSEAKAGRAPHSLPPSVPTSSVISRIERELRELWAQPSGSSVLVPPTARACTMNLVVVAGSSDLADRYTRVVDEVAAAIPSRAIIIALEAETIESGLTGNVVKVGPPNEAYVGSERVRLTACGQVVDRVASAVEALCVPEVPTTLVWLGRVHVDDPVFRSIAREVQRVILDTDYTSLTSLVALAKVTAGRESAELADLAWTRLATWQELCARFFDAPHLMAAAHGVSELTVTQASEPGARLGSEAALLIGWLATRLGWTSGRMGGQLRFKRKDGGDVKVKLASVKQPDGVAPAALAGVRIAAHAGEVSVLGTIDRALASGPASEAPQDGATRSTRDADMLHWKIEVGGEAPFEQQVRLGANKGAKLLERTLHRAPSDATLLEAIAFAERVFDDGVIAG